MLLELIEVDRVRGGRHLHGQGSVSVCSGASEEAVHFLFVSEHEGVVLEFNYEQTESLFHFAFVLKCNGAVALDSFFLVNNLRGLICPHAHGSVAFRAEDNFLGEDAGVLNEGLLGICVCEVIELMAVKHAELRTMAARFELLMHLPRNGAVVTVLRDALFEINAVNWHASHNAWAAFGLVVPEVTSELRAGCKVSLDLLQSQVLYEPPGAACVDALYTVVCLLEEVVYLGKVLDRSLNSLS